MQWFLPTWNGDFRLNPVPDEKAVDLVVHDATADEVDHLAKFLTKCRKKKWIDKSVVDVIAGGTTTIRINGPMEKVGPELTRLLKPKKTTLTAVVYKDGKVETAESWQDGQLEALAQRAAAEKAKAAASVSRPTPSCPECYVGPAIAPATDVLLSFLDEGQHEDWRKYRAIVVLGGYTGHRYLIAHRHTPRAAFQGRIAYDLDDKSVMHFYDWSVPPEEEVLGAKLILESRENWLRNEATCFGNQKHVFKNPFGGVADGTESAGFLQGFARGLRGDFRDLTRRNVNLLVGQLV